GGNVLVSSDGGIARLLTQNDALHTPRYWVSENGNLRTLEFYSVAYDPLNRTILGGAQDNGQPYQTSEGSQIWMDSRGSHGGWVQITQSGGSLYYYDNTFNQYPVGVGANGSGPTFLPGSFFGVDITIGSPSGTPILIANLPSPFAFDTLDSQRVVIE